MFIQSMISDNTTKRYSLYDLRFAANNSNV